MASTPDLLPGESHDGGAWWAAVHGVEKSWTRLNDFPFTFHFHALEKEMATNSSILVWKIPWTEEPGGLQSMASQTVRQLSNCKWMIKLLATADAPNGKTNKQTKKNRILGLDS